MANKNKRPKATPPSIPTDKAPMATPSAWRNILVPAITSAMISISVAVINNAYEERARKELALAEYVRACSGFAYETHLAAKSLSEVLDSLDQLSPYNASLVALQRMGDGQRRQEAAELELKGRADVVNLLFGSTIPVVKYGGSYQSPDVANMVKKDPGVNDIIANSRAYIEGTGQLAKLRDEFCKTSADSLRTMQ